MKFKYTISLLLFSFLIVNCNLTEQPLDAYSVPEKPKVKSEIDSVKYKNEIRRVDSLFQKLHLSNQFNGNVLIARNNELIYKKSFGYGVKEKNIRLTDTSLFQLASVSKVITGIGVLLLYEQGKLKLDQLVCEILPEFPYKDITVQHLLSHRSGLPNYTYFCSEFLPDDGKILCNQDILNVMVKNKPKPYFNTNYRFNYSNTNFVLLALIIEKISQKSYSDFLNTELFIPIGMKHTYTYRTLDFFESNCTQGYTQSYKVIKNDRYDGILGDKGIFSTTYDMFLLSTALYQKKLLSLKTQAMAYTPYSKEKKLSNYGLGWRMKNMDVEDKEVFHNGWWHGYRTAFHRRLKDGLTIVILSNRLNSSVYSTWQVYQAIDGKQEVFKEKDTATSE